MGAQYTGNVSLGSISTFPNLPVCKVYTVALDVSCACWRWECLSVQTGMVERYCFWVDRGSVPNLNGFY